MKKRNNKSKNGVGFNRSRFDKEKTNGFIKREEEVSFLLFFFLKEFFIELSK